MGSVERDQKLMALMMEEVVFWKPHFRFVRDLMDVIVENEDNLTDKQLEHLHHHFYKYREQVRDSVIYEETAPDELYEMIDGDVRKEVDRLMEKAKEDYKG